MMSAQRRSKRGSTGGAARGGRQRGGGGFEKTINMVREPVSPAMTKGRQAHETTDGVFANPRFTHLTTSLIGCVVRLQVKNGGIYEGILKTFSPKMDVVLEMAHKCEDLGNNNQNAVSGVPSRERLIEKILFSVGDILTICAIDVDMDYCVKDSFTDSAISKHNGQAGDSPLRELQPWDSEDGVDIGGLEGGDPANGWDATEMFRTNAEQFNVKSTYDETLKMYTTPLDKSDSHEYKAREEKAAKIAQEIEKSDQYKNRIALENGDETNEEEKFSSVKQTQENNSQGKYIHPNKRIQHPHQHQPNRSLQRGIVQNHHYHNLPNRGGAPLPPRITSPPQPIPVHNPPPPVLEEAKHNNIEKEDSRWGDTSEQSTKASPVPESVVDRQQPPPLHQPPLQQQPPPPLQQPPPPLQQPQQPPPPLQQQPVHTSPVSNKVDRRNSTPKAREVIFEELKGFKKQFKLEKESKEKDDDKENLEVSPVVSHDKIEERVPQEPEKREEKRETEDTGGTVIVEKSGLNPLAKIFIPGAGGPSFQPKQQPPPQIPTPPRAHTHSPMAMPAAMPPAHTGMFHQQQPQATFMLPPAVVSMPAQVPPSSSQLRPTKRGRDTSIPQAVVSIQQGHRPDISAAQATGQPLLAAHHSVHTPHHTQFILQMPPGMMPQHAGYPMGQVLPMPSTTTAAPPRMVTPTSLSMVPTSHPGAIDHNSVSHSGGGGPIFSKSHSGSGGHIYMNPPSAPVPAHIHHQFSHAQHPQPAHMGPQQNQPGGQMNPQSNTHHPAPSPVQQQGPAGQSHNQGHPPSSGTPQPHPNYQQMGLQHPPLQASPHNPTSPQTMHTMPQAPYHYPHTAGAHGQQNNQPFSLNQGHGSNNTSHNMPGQSPHLHGQPQIVMMPTPHNQVQQNSQQPQPHSHQFQQHGVPHHMAGHGQGGHINFQNPAMQGMQANNHNNLHQQIPPYVPQVHSQGGPPGPVQSYPQNH